MKNEIISQIKAECPWRDTLYWYDSLDSTNTQAKRLAKEGASHGTVVIAGSQTGGRGRMGRSFSSPGGMGVYLSVILRPDCTPDKLMHLTCAAAVAACKAVEAVSGVCPDIKWTNDLLCCKKKLGGILTELSVSGGTGLVDFAIVGIGINCCQRKADFPSELQAIATSLAEVTEKPCSVTGLAAALTEAIYDMDKALSDKEQIMDAYRQRCTTLGKEIVVLHPRENYCATALDVDADGGLVVRLKDGTVKTVNSGEISVRNL